MTQDQCERAMRRITGTTNYEGLADCQLMIEAAVEDLAAKREVFKRLGEISTPEAILSSIPRHCPCPTWRRPAAIRGG